MYSLSIQPGFEEVINDVEVGDLKEDQFWINIFDNEKPADDQIVNEEIIKILKEEEELKFLNDEMQFTKSGENIYKAYYKGEEHTIKAPIRVVKTGVKGMY
ncbi:hypothetical protein BN7_5306 [Wickerhamomyces ciferrii]|uniref:Uncharacterized protein n=1 Tax=Wickerhamomyces ciferrii (strain ATCC 14091 / BCRC 22168 / CBS 111 / JCM 3599 / NBRC 0793 / NRRL Y-1031 F-60-10) TaxID=1206466 RepID=K0KRF4_WICCF|nr:uncharacterized protein BN7_5306 [Wickerhamomyces ciferrii]CCH45721.1 hypothetical protein BN7_5306 [Wickerhamomyces ciferrii]